MILALHVYAKDIDYSNIASNVLSKRPKIQSHIIVTLGNFRKCRVQKNTTFDRFDGDDGEP